MAGRKQRGRGGGRGYRGGRGFPRGGGRGGRGGSRGRGWGGGAGHVAMHEIDDDFVIQSRPFQPLARDNSWRGAAPPNARGYKHAGKGRGFGSGYELDYSDGVDNSDYYSRYSTPVQGTSPGPGSSRGNGHQRGRGRWGIAGPDVEPKDRLRKRHLESKLRSGNASLSQLLYEDRPFLKPITFVRSQVTPTLFLRDEEIFKPVAEEAGEQEASHVPTAERVYRIFHGGSTAPQLSEPLSDEEELLEIDYADLGKFLNEIEATAASSKNTKTTIPAAAIATTSIATSVEDDNQPVVTTVEEGPTGFYIDTKPSPVQDSSTSTNDIAVEHPRPGILGEDIGDDDDDDEIIVYVAPHPRNGKLPSVHTQSPHLDAKTLPPSGPASVAAPVHQKTYDAPNAPALPPEPEPQLWPEPVPKVNVPAPAPAPALAFKNFSFSLLSSSPKPTYHRARWPRRIARRKAERNRMFGSFGAMRAEATLRELDPRRAEQRRGDSDVDWGGSTSGLAEVEDSEDDGGMLVDEEIKADAMAAFVRSMGAAGQAHISAGDLEDEERIRLEDADEDEEEDESGSNEEDVDTELELADGMRILAAEGDDDDEVSRSSFADDDDDDTSDDQEVTPKRSFQARLERIRSRTVGRPVKDMMREELDQEQELDDDDDDSDSDIDDEDSIIAQIQGFLDENDDVLRAKDRKQRNHIFRAIRNGNLKVILDDFIDSSPKRKRDKHVPAELHDQWERDRRKKAERKRLRELERIAAAADPFTLTKKKRLGKKERKKAARKAAASPISLETVVGHMRRFVEDLGSAPTLSLPPMERHARKSVHELASAFNLNSKSEGNGAARFTRLVKTTRSGLWIDERKVARILGKPAPPHGGDKDKGKGKGKAGVKIRPRDGELVGGAAPKIDGSNLGFKMLSAMGWEEGNRIGTVGGVGLDIPLVAVIKTTKLGLGASSHKS
ncbi:hypothetical protein EDB92DRAFT_1854568 [Lactarius akahatsu]|uniref:Protein SQS1 n=1 Tax=Lactarius akahatsu TaxID=416441 RepID=A0AAD4LJI8_9AGAM|nr:hypothetical protein EDB92DRAFT_1854568 [Lactarius akahatsu]